MTPVSPVALITGAGTGIGRACALRLALVGWRLVLLGRRREPLQQVAEETDGHPLLFPGDIGNADFVNNAIAGTLEAFGRIDALVNSAGTNIPRRSLEVLTHADYHRVIETNLHGAFNCVQAVLPVMRRQRAGTIVNISSEAGRQASAKSGAAYVISKFGLTGLSQSINAEERAHGIRSCSIFPGDVNTPLVSLRPEPPSAEARDGMLTASDVAECVWLAISLPARAIVEELVVRPR